MSLDEARAHEADTWQNDDGEAEAPHTSGRRVRLPDGFELKCKNLLKHTEIVMPVSILGRYCAAWAESLTGALDGYGDWGVLCHYRARLLLANFDEECDRKQEMKDRLKLWEQGTWCDLIDRVSAAVLKRRESSGRRHDDRDGEEKKGDACRKAACNDALSKGIQRLVGLPAEGTSQEKSQWAPMFLPSAPETSHPIPTRAQRDQALIDAWGDGDPKKARRQMQEVHMRRTGRRGLPWATFPALSGTGPSGDRYEHLRECMASKAYAPKKRLKKALDRLMACWAAGTVPSTLRWLLDSSLFWLSKMRNGK